MWRIIRRKTRGGNAGMLNESAECGDVIQVKNRLSCRAHKRSQWHFFLPFPAWTLTLEYNKNILNSWVVRKHKYMTSDMCQQAILSLKKMMGLKWCYCIVCPAEHTLTPSFTILWALSAAHVAEHASQLSRWPETRGVVLILGRNCKAYKAGYQCPQKLKCLSSFLCKERKVFTSQMVPSQVSKILLLPVFNGLEHCPGATVC